MLQMQQKDGHYHKMDKLGLDLDDGSSGGDKQDPQENRKQSIQRCIQSLVHACGCRDADCRRPNCNKMKLVVAHTRRCRRKAKSGCPLCKEFLALCCCHAKQCNEQKCHVPICQQIKQRLRLLELQQSIPGRRHAVPEPEPPDDPPGTAASQASQAADGRGPACESPDAVPADIQNHAADNAQRFEQYTQIWSKPTEDKKTPYWMRARKNKAAASVRHEPIPNKIPRMNDEDRSSSSSSSSGPVFTNFLNNAQRFEQYTQIWSKPTEDKKTPYWMRARKNKAAASVRHEPIPNKIPRMNDEDRSSSSSSSSGPVFTNFLSSTPDSSKQHNSGNLKTKAKRIQLKERQQERGVTRK